MQSAHNLQPIEPSHAGILAAAAFEGTNTEPMPGAKRYLGFGATKHGFGPACIVDDAGTEHVAEPHVTWFPWTTKSNRIVNFKWAMAHLAETREVFLTVQKSEIEFFEHFVKRGLLRKVGFLENLPVVEEIHMYQYKRRKA